MCLKDCAVADFLTAVFGEHYRVRIVQALGMESDPRHPLCPRCGKEMFIPSRGFCSVCIDEMRCVMVACEECGELIKRSTNKMVRLVRYGYERSFCGHRCQGRWLGRKNAGSRRPRTKVRESMNKFKVYKQEEGREPTLEFQVEVKDQRPGTSEADTVPST